MKKTEIRSIAFFYPSKNFGGAENLIIRLTQQLLARNYKITIIDYKNGVVISKLRNLEGIRFLEYFDNKPLFLSRITHLVSFSLRIENIRRQFIVRDRIVLLIWFIHPYHIFRLIEPIPWNVAQYLYMNYKRKIRQMLTDMDKKSSVVFMCNENYYISKEYFGLKFMPKYLQIPVNGSNYEMVKKYEDRGQLSFVWLGRLAVEKVNILIYVLHEVKKHIEQKNIFIDFYIVGSGSAGIVLNRYLDDYSSDHINIKRIEMIPPEDLREFLKDKKLLFAMGTSALEGGILGLPTILLDYSYYDYRKIIKKGYKFKWLYQTRDYKIGSNIFKNFKAIESENKLEMDDIFDTIIDPVKSKEIAQNCQKYSYIHHRMGVVIQKMSEILKNASFTIQELVVYDLSKNIFERVSDSVYIFGKKIKKNITR